MPARSRANLSHRDRERKTGSKHLFEMDLDCIRAMARSIYYLQAFASLRAIGTAARAIGIFTSILFDLWCQFAVAESSLEDRLREYLT